ncbi:MAG: type II toxin-antitoxin system VapC family toxin, partial [Clostridia bacterium]|nr:type II toxin-antitoxin system VapC family toxin [Clostridia bacterium]
MYLLDTNVCAYLMKGRYPALNEKVLTVPPDELSISAVTLFELEYGAAKANWGAQRMADLHLFLSAFQ